MVPGYSLYEHHVDKSKHVHGPVWQPRQTTLHVVFDGESRHLFSSTHVLIYYRRNGSPRDAQSGDVWDIQQLRPVVHAFRGQVQDPPPNPSILPKLTIALEVVASQTASAMSESWTRPNTLVLRSFTGIQEVQRNAIIVLLECELSLTSDTSSLALSFTHSTMLWTSLLSRHPPSAYPVTPIEYITTRIVRVLPPKISRPKVTNGRLPMELLIKIFEDDEFRYSWHDDLLSFAQVCRAWSCAMYVLQSNLTFSEDEVRDQPRHLLDALALAKALTDKPSLGLAFHHLTTNNIGKLEDWEDIFSLPLPCESPAQRTEALITILRTTKNMQYLHLAELDPRQANALFTVLYELRDLRTLSIGREEEKKIKMTLRRDCLTIGETRLLSIVQLARCMGQWRALKTLKVHHPRPGVFRMWRLALRPPACTLAQLAVSHSRMGDKDLAHLFASSAKTLQRVVLDQVEGITNAGLLEFLLAISQNVAYLTIQDVALPPFQYRASLLIGSTERALDVAVDKMPRLQELRINGDVASVLMLDRRSKMFVARDTSDENRVPVVQLWMEYVPRLCGFVADEKWPGWCTSHELPRRLLAGTVGDGF